MNSLNDLTDEEFVPFLKGLGVETYNKSFEWMLTDSEFSGVLRWLYNNLDHNNALSAREEYRYLDLEKKGLLLPLEDLESAVSSIQSQYPSICLPGDKEYLEYVKLDIKSQKEKLHMLKRHEEVLKDMIKQNKLVKDDLNVELAKLDSAKQECSEDLTSAAEECQTLAAEVEAITDSVVDVIANKLDVYVNCHVDKELAHKFITFGPLEAYRQTQALFKSHFDLFTSKKFAKQSDITDEELRMTLIEAKNLEERLTHALYSYVDSKVELSGKQAKLALVSNYTAVHPSQATTLSMDAQTSKELLAQEETILMQQIQDAMQELVNSRTRLAVETTTRSALAVREQVLGHLNLALEWSQHALACDRLLLRALRHELGAAEQSAYFAHHLRTHLNMERDVVKSRIASMNEIISEQESIEQDLPSTDVLLQTIYKILGLPPGDALSLVKIYSELEKRTKDYENEVLEGFKKKEEGLNEFKKSLRPLEEYIYDGCTRQPNCWDRVVASLSHSLKHEMGEVDKRIVEIGSMFTSIKGNDKNNLRKLWQWFLTDKTKFISVVTGIQSSSAS